MCVHIYIYIKTTSALVCLYINSKEKHTDSLSNNAESVQNHRL